MNMIEREGKITVKIGDPYWEKLKPKNGDDARMALVLPLTTEAEELAFYRASFTRTIIQSGKNRGRALYEVSAENCIELGMSEPFTPVKIGELEGRTAEAVVEIEIYDGESRYTVKYLNSPRSNLDMDDVKEMWAKLTGDTQSEPSSANESAIEDEDDLPF